MDTMTLLGGNQAYWLVLVALLVLVDVSARKGASWLRDLFGNGPDRSSFRYRRRD